MFLIKEVKTLHCHLNLAMISYGSASLDFYHQYMAVIHLLFFTNSNSSASNRLPIIISVFQCFSLPFSQSKHYLIVVHLCIFQQATFNFSMHFPLHFYIKMGCLTVLFFLLPFYSSSSHLSVKT